MSSTALDSPVDPLGADAVAEAPTTRMGIALLALVGVLVSTYLMLHRLGYIGSLACGVDGGCSTVQSSEFATFVGIPVPLVGLVGYGALMAVALASISPRWQDSRALAALLFGMAGVGFLFSAYLTALEAFVIHAWCRWCVASAIIATLVFLLALAELPRLRRPNPRAP